MDIQYLLFLQNFRETSGAWLAPLADFATKLSVSFWPLAVMCLIYWVIDRKSGKRMLAGLGLGTLLNGFLKLTFCVYRPWIRDARVMPFGDSKVAATGYSFPSGHSTRATACYGNTGWWLRHRNKIVAGFLFFLVAFTMFSRNFLGVHTPQDVVVGFLSTALMIFVATKIEDWTDKDIKRDKIVIIAGLLLCVGLVTYYFTKSYPMTYLPDGSLLVDPTEMRGDSFKGIGFISAFVICRYFERRYFDFEKVLERKNRLIVSIVAMLPMAWWYNNSIEIIKNVTNNDVAKFTHFAFFVVYAMIIVPAVMVKVGEMMKKRQEMKEDLMESEAIKIVA